MNTVSTYERCVIVGEAGQFHDGSLGLDTLNLDTLADWEEAERRVGRARGTG